MSALCDCTEETPLILEREPSSTSVTSDSTFSALAPGSVVTTIRYGRSMSGRRLVFIFERETPPKMRMMITATVMMYGRRTLKRLST